MMMIVLMMIIVRVKIIYFLCIRDGVGDREIGVCIYVSVVSMGKEERCKAGVWIS